MFIFFAYRLSPDVNAVEIMDAFCAYLFLESLRLMKQSRGKLLFLNAFSEVKWGHVTQC